MDVDGGLSWLIYKGMLQVMIWQGQVKKKSKLKAFGHILNGFGE